MRPSKAAPRGQREAEPHVGGEGGDKEEPSESTGAAPAAKALPSPKP